MAEISKTDPTFMAEVKEFPTFATAELTTAKEDRMYYSTRIMKFTIGVGLCLSVFCSNLDRSILGIATPKITTEFNSSEDIAWYGSAYLLTSCCSQLLFGKLYARYNIKWIFLASLGIFEVGSIFCAAAPSSNCLIAGRAVAGLGATGISTGALLIISCIMPLSERPNYIAAIGACMGISLVIGPFLGGVFTDKLTWRWCFWVNLPFGGLTLIIIFLLVKLPANTREQDTTWRDFVDNIDLPGTVILLPSVVCLLLALQWGGSTYTWGSWQCIMLLCIFGVGSLVWCFIQVRQGGAATVPLGVLKRRSMLGSIWFAFCLFGMMFVQSYYIPIYFQAVKNDSAYRAGINLLGNTAAMTVFFIISGMLTSKIGYYVPSMIAGSIVSAVASGLMIGYYVTTGTGYWVTSLILSGIGFGLGAQQCMMVPQAVLEGDDIALGTSVIMFAETISGTIFLAISQRIFENKLIYELFLHTPTVSPSVVIASGVSSLQSAMREKYGAGIADKIIELYANSLQPVWIMSALLGSLSLLGAISIEWVSVREDKGQV
ncbi:Efflux pump roqT [Lachnellula suecica]|uniref:Efflux pump roqT n=1 Tax=Lachnellula suecica TaxID=602035 RepID=A0A8T9CJJ3_9HELO|nr:Efflux pump roqT [Lachnellula suecica]